MIHKNGSMFKSTASYFAHGVNTKGVMGAGVAALFRDNFPGMYQQYRADCLAGRVQPGQYDVVREKFEGREVFVVNIASQDNPGPDAQYDWLANAVMCFAKRASAPENLARCGGIVAMPEIGCGIGGLEWPVVETILEMVETIYPEIEFEVWHYEAGV